MKTSRLEIALDQSGLNLPKSGRIGIFRAISDADYSSLPSDQSVLINSNRVEYDRLKSRGFDVADTPEGQFALSIVDITRSKAETLGLIARALMLTQPGGMVVVDGAKTDGIESVLKQCKSILPIENTLSKSHGKIFWMTRPENITKPLSETLDDWHAALVLKPIEGGFETADGMFSPHHADAGSLLLASHFDGRLKGHVADLGAGWGWLATQALKAGDVTAIDLFEAEKTALDAAARNVTGQNAQFIWADVHNLSTETRYDAVICNPPFHQGRAAEPALGVSFIQKAADILKPNGNLWLVANRQLPYETTLEQCFKHWKYLEETPTFKAILATKPLSAKARQRRANPVTSR